MEVTLWVFGTLIILLVIKLPVAFATTIATLVGIIVAGLPMMVLPQRMFFGVDNFVMIAIPLFILTGKFMEIGGITNDLLGVSRVLVGRFRGGLAYVNIVASMIFAGITGSAAADTASIGSILIPSMIEEGYEKDFSVAVTATSSTIGGMIPPSIAMVLYGIAANQSIGKLFLGGIIPGIMVGVSLMIVSSLYARKRGYPKCEKVSVKEATAILFRGIPAMMTVAIVIGGIVFGIFTPTEAAGIGALYSLLLGIFFYKEIQWKDIPKIIFEVSKTIGMVMLLVGSASALAWLLASQQIPLLITQGLTSLTDNKIIILLLVNVLLLFVGTWLDQAAAITVFTPILLPAMTMIGIDPIHFGVIMIVNLAIGLFTPPVGICLFISCGIAEISITDTIKTFIPFFFAILVVLMIVTFSPALVMWLPNLFGAAF